MSECSKKPHVIAERGLALSYPRDRRFVRAAMRLEDARRARKSGLRTVVHLPVVRKYSVRPRRATNATRLTLVVLARFIEWRPVLTVVQPDTLVRWHRHAFRLFWRWKSRPRGRPRIPLELQYLIADMANANRTWGEERIAAEPLLKLGIAFSPRTVRRYMCRRRPIRPGARTQMWTTCVRNHAREVLACDFFVTVTAGLRLVYVFIVLDVGTRRFVHWNVTEQPTAPWVVQQFRTCVTDEGTHRFIVHDRDSIYSEGVSLALRAMGLRVLKTPVAVPEANAYCERVIGTARRECLDWVIPVNERHLRRVLAEWVPHYNRGRPHSSLGPGIPDPPSIIDVRSPGHRLPSAHRVTARPILGGLHHEYGLEAVAA